MGEATTPAATSAWRWAWAQLTSYLWYRVSLFACAAIGTALIASVVVPFVPDWLTNRVDDRATWDILSILASSMLVVATFSLGTMVAAYSAVASLATPRAAKILIDDPYSQNVLATFLGAFVFASVGLVALGFSYYSRPGKTVLLLGASIVMLFVIATFFAWLDHLANLVRLGETIRKVEVRAARVLTAHAREPRLGAEPLETTDEAEQGHPVMTPETLYVVHIDMPALQSLAESREGRIVVLCLPGMLTDPTRPLVRASWEADADDRAAIRRAFILGCERSFDQDPRFCLDVLAEIGSRAMSPGINDLGTAIGIVTTLQRLLTLWLHTDAEPPRFPRLSAPAIKTTDLFNDAFGPMTRDAAGCVEVGLRLQKSLVTLAALGLREEATMISNRALAHADESLIADDRARLAAVAAELGRAPGWDVS